MRVQVDCYPCILTQLATLARNAVPEETEQHKLVKELLGFVLEADDETTPPEFASRFHRVINERSGVFDPFRAEKDRSTELGLELLPGLRRRAEAHADPFEAAVRIATGGNIIDYGVNPNFDLREAEEAILEVFDLPVNQAAIRDLKARMDSAESIFYMLDNCGEAVLDRLLIEPYREKITIGVRGNPILNDVTRREAELSGITGCRVVDTGDMAPGVSLRNSSPEFLKELHSADLVVAKGQGNFESLDELFTRPIYFLLRVKCAVISKRLKREKGALAVLGRNLR